MKTASHTCPGIIVLDATEIQTLSTPYRQNWVTPFSPLAKLLHSTGSYLDLLVLMAARGWKVVIPEMVAFEAADVLADGTWKGQFFTNHRQNYSSENYTRKFLTYVASGHYQNITIVPGTEGEYGEYLRRMNEAIDSREGRSPETRDILRNINLKAVDSEFKASKKHFGERHCGDIILQELARQRQSKEYYPIFFMSADKDARSELKSLIEKNDFSNITVKSLTSNGFFLSLHSAHAGAQTVLRNLGLRAAPKEHWNHIFKEQAGPHQKLPPHIKPIYNNYYDAPLGHYDSADLPFHQAVAAWAPCVAEERRQEAKEHRVMPRPISRLDKFRAKYGDDYRKRGNEQGR